MKKGWTRNSLILCGAIGIVMATGVIGIADVLKEYSFVICMALLVGMLVVGVCMAAIANLNGATKPRIDSEAEEKEFREREVLREDILKTAYDTLQFFSEERTSAGKIIIQRRGDSIVGFIEDEANPHALFTGIRGLPVIHFSVRIEEEADRRIEVFCGSYIFPPTCFSLEQRWDALKLATNYVQTFKLPNK